MNNTLARIIDETSPKFNKEVTDGNVPRVLKGCPEYLDAIFRSSIKSLSPSVDMEYLGVRRLTPEEEFRYSFTGSPPRATYDIAVSDIYMVEFMFRYGNEYINKPMYLPYALDGNILRISSAVYAITPVLSDTVISPSSDKVFVRLLKDKLTFESFSYNIIFNGERKPKHMLYTTIIKTSKLKIMDNLGKVVTAASLYLLGEYGLRGSIKKYAGIDDVVITNKSVDKLREHYNVYESTGLPPKALKEKRGYVKNEIKICIPKSANITTYLENLIVGAIYTIDVLPHNQEDLLNADEHRNLDDERMYWRIALGRIAYNNTYSIDRIGPDTDSHFNALQGYLDNLIQEKLRENDIIVDTFFDLIAVLLSRFNTWLLNSKMYNSDISNRYIDIYYYILYDIIIGFNKVILNINKRADKKIGILDLKEINKMFNNDFIARKIFSVVKSKQISLAAQSISDYTLDIKYPKITALLEDQSRGDGVKRSAKVKFPEATKSIKAQQLAMGSLLFLSKTAPSPVFKSNMYMLYNTDTGKLIIPPELQKKLDKLEKMLQGRTENINVETIDGETVLDAVNVTEDDNYSDDDSDE